MSNAVEEQVSIKVKVFCLRSLRLRYAPLSAELGDDM
jgi:hypothetical protein